MIKNYILTILRSLDRSRLYAAINVLGLAFAIACFALVWLLVRYEWMHDRWHPEAERVFRITERVEKEGVGEHSSSVPFPLGPTLQAEYPSYIAAMVRLFNFQLPLVSITKGERAYNESGFYLADPGFFRVFGYPLARQLRDSLLTRPFEVVISARVARAYFGEADPLGDTLLLQGRVPLCVVGVFAEQSQPSHFQFDFIASFATLDAITLHRYRQSWVWNPCWTYIRLQAGIEREAVEAILPRFTERHLYPVIPDQVSLSLQALTSIHLRSHLDYELRPNSDMRYLYAFGLLGILVLVMGGLNFMQLSLSRATLRAKEIAVRRVLGADRYSLLLQFLAEVLVLGSLAVLVAFILVEQALPYLRTLSGQSLPSSEREGLFGVVLGVGFGVSIGGSIYPSMLMLGFDVRRIFSGRAARMPSRQHFNRLLVRIQFTISVVLLVFTFTQSRQLDFLRSFDLGFDTQSVFVIPLGQSPEIRRHYASLLREINAHPDLILASAGAEDILGKAHQTRPYIRSSDSLLVFSPSLFIGEQFPRALGLRFLAGGDFDSSRAAYDQLLINSSMVRQMGFAHPEQAIGQYLSRPEQMEGWGKPLKRIQGVVADVHFTSLYEPMAPFVFELRPEEQSLQRYLMVRHVPGKGLEAQELIEQIWAKYANGQALVCSLLSEELQEMYQQELILGRTAMTLTWVVLLISAMGLFALATFVVSRREKEIGIRRVLGANTWSLVVLLNGVFLRLLVQSILLGWVLAYGVLWLWFERFAYHVRPPLSAFLWAAGVVFGVMLLSVSVQTLRASLRTPVRAIQRGI